MINPVKSTATASMPRTRAINTAGPVADAGTGFAIREGGRTVGAGTIDDRAVTRGVQDDSPVIPAPQLIDGLLPTGPEPSPLGAPVRPRVSPYLLTPTEALGARRTTVWRAVDAGGMRPMSPAFRPARPVAGSADSAWRGPSA
jgi:hypothetical protein